MGGCLTLQGYQNDYTEELSPSAISVVLGELEVSAEQILHNIAASCAFNDAVRTGDLTDTPTISIASIEAGSVVKPVSLVILGNEGPLRGIGVGDSD